MSVVIRRRILLFDILLTDLVSPGLNKFSLNALTSLFCKKPLPSSEEAFLAMPLAFSIAWTRSI